MRVIEPVQFRKLTKPKIKHSLRNLVILALIALLAGYGTAAYAKPLPVAQGRAATLNMPAVSGPTLEWPQTGQAAFGASDFGVLAESGAQTTAPMASVAKVITALTVLQAKPLHSGEQGPLITIGDADIQSYNDYVAQGGSVVPVNSGETISEYQALQALLLPSANNMADTLVRWAFGSVDAYLTQAAKLVTSLGLKQTTIADTSGFSPLTKSTPHDLVTTGLAAMRDPVFAEIVGQKTATIPVAGEVDNINGLLGQDGINGIKTGNTEEAGGCLLFSAVQKFPNGQQLTLVGAVMGEPSLTATSHDSTALLRSAIPGFRVVTALRGQTTVATYSTAWQSSAPAVVASDVSLLIWSGQTPQFKVNAPAIKWSTRKGTTVGSLSVMTGSITKTLPIMLDKNLTAPTTTWRLSHLLRKT